MPECPQFLQVYGFDPHKTVNPIVEYQVATYVPRKGVDGVRVSLYKIRQQVVEFLAKEEFKRLSTSELNLLLKNVQEVLNSRFVSHNVKLGRFRLWRWILSWFGYVITPIPLKQIQERIKQNPTLIQLVADSPLIIKVTCLDRVESKIKKRLAQDLLEKMLRISVKRNDEKLHPWSEYKLGICSTTFYLQGCGHTPPKLMRPGVHMCTFNRHRYRVSIEEKTA